MAFIGSSTHKEKVFWFNFRSLAQFVFPKTKVYKISEIGSLKKKLQNDLDEEEDEKSVE